MLNDTLMGSTVMTRQQKATITKTYRLEENANGELNLVFDPRQYVCKKLNEADILEIKKLFHYFDDDGNQTLSPIDIQNMLHAFELFPDKETLYAIVSRFDQTESGTLTFDDFIKIFTDTH